MPHALGGHNALHAWLEPAFAGRQARQRPSVPAPRETAAEGEAAAEAEAHAEEALELTLMGVSSAHRGRSASASPSFIWLQAPRRSPTTLARELRRRSTGCC